MKGILCVCSGTVAGVPYGIVSGRADFVQYGIVPEHRVIICGKFIYAAAISASGFICLPETWFIENGFVTEGVAFGHFVSASTYLPGQLPAKYFRHV